MLIAGGGPAGLSAALILGRARKRVLLCDAGAPRNAAAERVQGIFSRDGTPPAELRGIAREQLAPYESVDVRPERVKRIDGDAGAFRARLRADEVSVARVLLATGMVDVLPEIPNYRELWGRAVFQCPYCHGWELQGRAWGYLAPSAEWLDWSLLLRGWTSDVVVFTGGAFAVPPDSAERLARAGVRVVSRPVASLVARGEALEAIELDDATRVARDVLFVKPPQRHTDLVASLGLALDDLGFVRVDEKGLTSRAGMYAAGDLASPVQTAIAAAGGGARAAYALNLELTSAQALAGELP